MKSLAKSRLFKFLKRDNDSGGPTVEFVVVLIPFMVSFYWLFDTGWLAFQIVQLDRGVEMTTRELMVSDITDGLGASAAHKLLKNKVCDYGIIADCDENLVLDIQQFDSFTSVITTNQSCVNRTETDVEPKYTIKPSGCTTEPEIVWFRACLLVDPLLPPTLTAYEGSATSDGAIELRTVSGFLNEPC